jgi:hypothetical protein
MAWDPHAKPGGRRPFGDQTEQEKIEGEVQQTQIDQQTQRSADEGSGGNPQTQR